MNPRQHAGQIHRADLRPEQPVDDDDAGQSDQRKLQGESGMSPFQKPAEHGQAQQIKGDSGSDDVGEMRLHAPES